MAYVAPPGIGNPAATRGASSALRARARALEDVLSQLGAADARLQFEGPGATRLRARLRMHRAELRHEALRCLSVAGQLDAAAYNADAMLARQRREQAAEAAARRARG